MELETRKKAFTRLGEILRTYVAGPDEESPESKYHQLLRGAVEKAGITNPWFTPFSVNEALRSIGSNLKEEHLEKWTGQYSELGRQTGPPQTIGVVNAGNIPFVGFHDFLSVLLSGNIYYGKLSSKDEHLPKAIASILTDIEPGFREMIKFERKFLKQFDAIIATGSNNTSRYFHYYFSRYPHIIRKNRNGVAVLTGKENEEELARLADDIFLYFGMGCRNVSKLYLPEDFNLERLFSNIEHYHWIIDHHKYSNNYDYNKAILTMNRVPYLDNGFLLLREEKQIASPISTLYYERYHNLDDVREELDEEKSRIQCTVTHSENISGGVDFGQAQYPPLWDYADNIDTMQFLLNLNNSSN